MPYGVEPTLRDAWNRLGWAAVHLVYRPGDLSPYVIDGEGGLRPKNRRGWDDISHAAENVYRVWRRTR